MNFVELNNMLFVKFKQLEDTKQGVRDMLTYTKYFFPLQIQQMIGENMSHMNSALDDMTYMEWSKGRYTEMKDAISLEKKK